MRSRGRDQEKKGEKERERSCCTQSSGKTHIIRKVTKLGCSSSIEPSRENNNSKITFSTLIQCENICALHTNI